MHPDGNLGWPGACLRANRLISLLLVASALLSGCSGASHDDLDPDRAREALKLALDGWKKGDSPASLKEGTPSIVVQDLDWIQGAKLVDYQVSGDGKPVEANLYVPVKLILRNPRGRETTKSVNYVVATSPNLMVFRALK